MKIHRLDANAIAFDANDIDNFNVQELSPDIRRLIVVKIG